MSGSSVSVILRLEHELVLFFGEPWFDCSRIAVDSASGFPCLI